MTTTLSTRAALVLSLTALLAPLGATACSVDDPLTAAPEEPQPEGFSCGATTGQGGPCAAGLECRNDRCIDPKKTYVSCASNYCNGPGDVAGTCTCIVDPNPFVSHAISEYTAGCGAPTGDAATTATCCQKVGSCTCELSRWSCHDVGASCFCDWERADRKEAASTPPTTCNPTARSARCCAKKNVFDGSINEAIVQLTRACNCSEYKEVPCEDDEVDVASCDVPPSAPICNKGEKVDACRDGETPSCKRLPDSSPTPGTPDAGGPKCKERGGTCTGDEDCCGGLCCGDFMGCC